MQNDRQKLESCKSAFSPNGYNNAVSKSVIVRGARVHNLKGIDVEIPLEELVGIAGVSGSGKSSLALGVLYAEGSRRYLESLSTYTRRRMTGASRADIDEILHVPAALALHQRPTSGGIRSTFGTSSELLNSIRLMFSRLSSHRCPNGHYLPSSINVAYGEELICPICHEHFYAPSAEALSFNSEGACPHCGGTGIIHEVDVSTLIPDESLTIEEGAVAPWNSLMWSLMVDVCRAMGVRTNVPYKDLREKEKEIVLRGPAEKKHILYRPKNGDKATELDFTFYSAIRTVENALSKVKDETGMKRVERFLKEEKCPFCHGSRYSPAALAPLLHSKHIDQVSEMPLSSLIDWVKEVPSSLPKEMQAMAEVITESFLVSAKRLIDLGLGYLSLDRSSASLSTGERQRVQLARAVRNRTTGILYVLDEPSIGLHPRNQEGLIALMEELVKDGNSVVVVDHDPQILSKVNTLIELGPGAGKDGGRIIAKASPKEISANPASKIGKYLFRKKEERLRPLLKDEDIFAKGCISLHTKPLHTVKELEVKIPKGRLVAVTGVSGSGKTTLMLESLYPALLQRSKNLPLPENVISLDTGGAFLTPKFIDASPIGVNVRSTIATYANIHDELRKIFAKTKKAKEAHIHASDFSYNTGSLRCPVCEGTGSISLDVQFLPDVEITCPACKGTRYSNKANQFTLPLGNDNTISLPNLMRLEIHEALKVLSKYPSLCEKLKVLDDLGLSYLTVGEATPSLSGGEAQRLKLASEMGKPMQNSVFLFDEPTIGLHPLDVEALLKILDSLTEKGATVLVIEHDLDFIRNADWVIDMGPLGGEEGGEIVAEGTPEEIKNNPNSITGRYL